MVLLQPKQRAADQDTPHFVAAVIKHQGLPIRLKTLARVSMFIQMRAVEKAESMAISREVRRDPVQDDPDVMAMQFVDQKHQVLRRTIISGWSKVSRSLVAPGTEEGMIHDREKLHMGEAHPLNVRG